jgi:hypothetical protein
MLNCPAPREDGVAVNVILNPADVVGVAVLVMTTAPEELKPPLVTPALTTSCTLPGKPDPAV